MRWWWRPRLLTALKAAALLGWFAYTGYVLLPWWAWASLFSGLALTLAAWKWDATVFAAQVLRDWLSSVWEYVRDG